MSKDTRKASKARHVDTKLPRVEDARKKKTNKEALKNLVATRFPRSTEGK
jgi:hypothetical protein